MRIMAGSQYHKYEINPLDYILSALNTKVMILDEQSEEFRIIMKYIKSGNINLEEEYKTNIYAVERLIESETFDSKSKNRRLLFHGTRNENIMGILH